jgi:serine protease Do
MSTLFQQLNDELAEMIARVQQSVVQIRDHSRGAGAGTIWHSDGLIVTNAHVVHRGPLQVALSDGRVLTAKLLARDDERDLAALTVEADHLPVIQPGNSRRLQAGQWVCAVGHPWGITNAATGGVVIGLSNHIAELPVGAIGQNDWVVADLHLRPGNSGGPLVDVEGRLVGVNTIMTGMGVGMAVGVDAVKDFLKRAIGSTAATTSGVV